jgi:hypothetical protein
VKIWWGFSDILISNDSGRRLLCLLAACGAAARIACDPRALFERARAKVQNDILDLPGYACTETVARSYFDPTIRRGSACGRHRQEELSVSRPAFPLFCKSLVSLFSKNAHFAGA